MLSKKTKVRIAANRKRTSIPAGRRAVLIERQMKLNGVKAAMNGRYGAYALNLIVPEETLVEKIELRKSLRAAARKEDDLYLRRTWEQTRAMDRPVKITRTTRVLRERYKCSRSGRSHYGSA